MKVRTRLQRACGLTAWAIILPGFFVISGIMLAVFLISETLYEQLHTEE